MVLQNFEVAKVIYEKGCIQAGEEWVERNLLAIVTGAVATAFAQGDLTFGIRYPGFDIRWTQLCDVGFLFTTSFTIAFLVGRQCGCLLWVIALLDGRLCITKESFGLIIAMLAKIRFAIVFLIARQCGDLLWIITVHDRPLCIAKEWFGLGLFP
ncbi:hypothetical protein WN48_07587 [Eufriesea mexicana]|uniref:Uncharacterized protein n=1 Tax=Eufriesea mexicana TaxID=516756 RepID=A0A310SQV1_9HYME|nr:hypothetical protein WN48_07587 [Eufriesea mexicana]